MRTSKSRPGRGWPTLSLVAAVAVVAAAVPGASAQLPPFQPVIGNDEPDWSPDGRTIAFTSFRHGRGEIYLVDPTGRRERRLTRNPGHNDHAAWSPDGSKIAFSSRRHGNLEIHVMNADGTQPRRLTRNLGRDYRPAWSRDGSRIAFQSDRDGNTEIYVVNADGSGERRLTSHFASDLSPTWSPDGRIAWVSNRLGVGYVLWVMNADGSGQRKLTTSAAWKDELEPDWSPDGTRIAFVSDRDPPLGNAEIYVVDADGRKPTRVTRHRARDAGPAWSPDGRWIAFSRGPSAFRPEVYVMRADGSGLRKVTTTSVRFLVIAVERLPKRPLAGRRFTVAALVAEPTGDPVDRATVTCEATVAGRRLRATTRRFVSSYAVCAWNLPAAAKGKRLRIRIAAHVERSRAERRLVLAVR